MKYVYLLILLFVFVFFGGVLGQNRKNIKYLDSLINLSNGYKKINKIDSAYFILLKYIKLKDSLWNADYQKNSTDYQTKYKTEKKNRELAEQKVQEQLKYNRILYWSGTGILVLFMGGGLGFIMLNQRSKRKQTEQELKNQEAVFQFKKRETELELQISQIEFEIAQESTKSIDKAYKDINRLLHDELSADMGLVSNKLELIVMKDTEVQMSIINDLQNIRNRLRNIAHEIGYFTDKNLPDYLNEFFEIQKKKHKTINFEFSESPYENVTELIYGHQAKSLFVIIREAINNATKYAQATKIHTSVVLEDDKIKIQITDNGKGFDIEKVKKTGLQNIKERAFVLHGKLFIDSNEQGTTIIAIVPIDESS
jgi:signal transduction histidine kinase